MSLPLPPPPVGRRGWPWHGCRATVPDPTWPRVSIITPSYNQGEFLEATIRSVLGQGYPNLEYIVIDGGSGDASREIIAKYAPLLAHWVSEPDRGQSHALNKGLERASGEFVGWVNSDDVYCRGALAAVVAAFAADREAAVVYGDRLLLDREGDVAGWSIAADFRPERYGYPIPSEAAFWRASAAAGMRFDEQLRFAMDLDWFSRLRERGRFRRLRRFLGCLRCHAATKSSTMQDVCARETEAIWRARFGAHNDRYRLRPEISRLRWALAPAAHPWLIGMPYAWRRFVRGRRGTAEPAR